MGVLDPWIGKTITLENAHSGRVAGITGGSSDNGVNIRQWEYSNHKTLLWNVLSVGEAYALLNAESGKALAVAGGSSDNGANICQWQYTGTEDQLWSVRKDQSSRFGHVYVLLNVQSGKALAVAGESSDNGANLCQWEDSGSEDQQWRL